MYLDYLRDNDGSSYVQNKLTRRFKELIEPLAIANVVAFLLNDAAKTINGMSVLLERSATI